MESKVKAVFVGDTGVGKTSIINRITKDEFIEAQATVGAANVEVLIDTGDNRKVNFCVWDTAGQERYRSLAPMYFSGAALAFCVYDITRHDSLDALRVFIDMLQDKAPGYIKYVLVGNKFDLEEDRAVSHNEAEQFQHEIGAEFFIEVSAKSGHAVGDLFLRAALIGGLHKEELYRDLELAIDDSGKRDEKKCSC